MARLTFAVGHTPKINRMLKRTHLHILRHRSRRVVQHCVTNVAVVADYLARITLLNKMGHVHPVVTVLGVIVGLGLFGFIGLIFGPILISLFLVLIKIYANEFNLEKRGESSPR